LGPVPRVLVSNNSEVLRHLSAMPFRRLGLDVQVVSSGGEVLEAVRAGRPALAILDAELAEVSGYEAARRIKANDPDAKVVLIAGKRINAQQMKRVAESGCDEVLIAPMSADELYDVVAIQLGLPRRGSERYSIDLAVVTSDGHRTVDGHITNLSVDGARLVLPEAIAEGTRLRVTITPDDTGGDPLELDAQIVWAQPRDGETVAGASFPAVSEELRGRLARLTQWEIIDETERKRVVLKGDITEATSFSDLQTAMVGRVDFDMSQISYINSLGVREWVEFLRSSSIHGYEFHACSVPFVLQASLVGDVLGHGTIASFFAPYQCDSCEHQEERLLQTATVLASENNEPPVFSCPACGGKLVLDDLPDRYLAFLRGDAEE
jgi:CheY-like chemotaxis protein